MAAVLRTLPAFPPTVDLSSMIGDVQQHRRDSRAVLSHCRTAIASADRALLVSWMGWFEGMGPLVAATSTEEECLLSLLSSDADLLVCTDMLEIGSGPSLVRRAKEAHPRLKTLMLIQRPIVRTILEAVEAHCDGLCSHQSAGTGAVRTALAAIDSDGTYMDGVITGVLRHGRLGGSSGHGPLAELSLREEDVLRGLCRGMSNQQIADALVVSIDTVKSHVSSLLRKLPANDRTHAVVVAFREGLVELPSRPPRWRSGDQGR
jgi:DNA-binding NarL/FixJ family response regulator